MRIAIVAAIGVVLATMATGSLAAQHPPGNHPPAKRPPTGHPPARHATAAKPAPACAALVFRPLPGGTADGEQTAGMYRSRLARLELRGTVQNGTPANYYLMANGGRVAAAGQNPPPAAADCAAAKKMPRPGAAAASCTGDRFTVVVAHAGDKRYALLYAQSGGAWSFCNVGSF